MSKIVVLSTLAILLSGAAIADTAILYTTDDSYTMETQPDDNFGNVEVMFTGWYNAGQLYPVLLFDLSPYSDVTINSATLMLYIASSGGGFPPEDNWIARFTGSWDESTITWNNQPGWDDWYYTGNVPVLNDWWDVDVTSWTVAWADESHDNYGVFLGADGTSPSDYAGIWTKEHTGTDFDPYLYLDYTSTSIKSASVGEIKAIFK